MALPLSIPWVATTDANGNATFTTTPNASYMSSITVAGQAPGNPIWTIFRSGQFLIPGAGANVALGSIIFNPGDKLTVTVVGSTPNSQITGTLWGYVSTTNDGSDLETAQQQTQLSGAFPTFQQASKLVPNYTVTANAVNTTTVTISPGMQVITVYVFGQPDGSKYGFSIVGHQTGFEYASYTFTIAGVAGNNIPNRILVDYAFETQFDITIDASVAGHPAGTTTVAVLGGPNPVDQVNANIFDSESFTLRSTSGALNTFITNGSLPVANSSPASWQSPSTYLATSVSVTAGVYKNVIARVGAGTNFYLFWARFDIDAASGAVFAAGTDGATANIFGINDNGKGPYVIGPFSGGVPLGLNSGLYVFTTSNSTVRVEIAYTAA